MLICGDGELEDASGEGVMSWDEAICELARMDKEEALQSWCAMADRGARADFTPAQRAEWNERLERAARAIFPGIGRVSERNFGYDDSAGTPVIACGSTGGTLSTPASRSLTKRRKQIAKQMLSDR